MHAIWDTDRGRYEVTTSDGDILTVDTVGRLLVSMREGSWPLVSVDECLMGSPMALTVRDSSGTLAPWMGAAVVDIRQI